MSPGFELWAYLLDALHLAGLLLDLALLFVAPTENDAARLTLLAVLCFNLFQLAAVELNCLFNAGALPDGVEKREGR